MRVTDPDAKQRLLAQFEKIAAAAPNDYVKTWSLLTAAEIAYYTESKQEKISALAYYKSGLELATQLIALHDGVGNIVNDRPLQPTEIKQRNPTFYEDWLNIYNYYAGAGEPGAGPGGADRPQTGREGASGLPRLRADVRTGIHSQCDEGDRRDAGGPRRTRAQDSGGHKKGAAE